MDAYTVSLLKAWWGDAADRRERLLLRLPAAHHRRPLRTTRRRSAMLDGEVPGFIIVGENPAVGSANGRAAARGAGSARMARRARPRRDRDAPRSGTTSPEIESGERRSERHRDRGLLAARRRAHREGRHVHEHPAPAAVAPQGGRAAGRLPLGAVVLLPPRAASSARSWRARRSRRPRPAGARPGLGLPDRGRRTTSRPPRPCCARSTAADAGRQALVGVHRARRTTARPPAAAGSTAAATPTETNQARPAHEPATSRAGSRPSGAGPGRRTAASSTTAPRPIPTAGRGRSASATSGGTPRQGEWTGEDVPDFQADKRAGLRARPTAREAEDGDRAATSRSSCRPTGAAGCSRPAGSSTGRCRPTTSRTSRRSPTALYGAAARTRRGSSSRAAQPLPPERRRARRRRLPLRLHHLPADRAPHRRRHEPLPAVPGRAAAGDVLRGQPRARRASAGSSTAAGRRSSTARAAIEARVMVTERMRPLDVQGRALHQVGLPYHWGSRGLDAGRLGQRPVRDRARPERPHPGGQGGDVRHPARPATRGAARAEPSTIELAGASLDDLRRAGAARARRVLHRHDRLHRLQGMRGRLQGVERRPRRRLRLHRRLLRQQRRARRRHLAPRRVHRAGAAAARRRAPTGDAADDERGSAG